MAVRPHEHEGDTTLELAHGSQSTAQSDTDASPSRRAMRRAHAPRTSNESRRTTLSSFGLVGVALAVLLAGGAMLSGASGSTTNTIVDPQANAVRAIDGAPSYGPASGMQLNAGLVGIAATPSGRGYWTTAADGGVFTFGDARFEGSLAATPIARPVVGVASTRSGRGYWLVASDGGVFAFGDAGFYGSLANPGAAIAPIVAIASTPSGRGYWLVGSDGGVFAFGDAAFEGAATSFRHAAPIVSIAATPSGYGYYLLAADGGVFAFGDARFAGSAVDGQHLGAAIAIPASGKGYEVARTDGSVVGLAGAPSSAAPLDLLTSQHPVVGIATRRTGGGWLMTTLRPPAPQQVDASQDPFLRCTRAHESDTAGGYQAVSPDGVYRGAYQFLQSTWNNVARAAGRPDLVGVDPAAASPSDQDQLALYLFQHGGPGPWGGRCRGLS
jgi:hypothetical protein